MGLFPTATAKVAWRTQTISYQIVIYWGWFELVRVRPPCYTESVGEGRKVMKMSEFVEVGFSSEVRKALADFVAGKALEAEGKAKKAEAEKILREALGEAKVAKIGGAVAYKLVNGSNRSADLKALAENYPEAYEAVVRVSEYDFVRAV